MVAPDLTALDLVALRRWCALLRRQRRAVTRKLGPMRRRELVLAKQWARLDSELGALVAELELRAST